MKVYFVDTNYILRLLLRDNESQFQTVFQLFEQAVDGKVLLISSVIVFFELYLVLSSVYKKDKISIVTHLNQVLGFNTIQFENQQTLEAALVLFEQNTIDLEDCFIIASAKQKKSILATFDQKAMTVFKKF